MSTRLHGRTLQLRAGGLQRIAAWAALAVLVMVFAALPAPARAGEIISVGDSYSSGEGAAPYDSGTDSDSVGHKCHRSAYAWPRQIGVTSDHHLACSGALIDNVFGVGQTTSGLDSRDQISQLKDIAADTPISRVVMTIGGNDWPVNFAKRLRNCRIARCLTDANKIIAALPTLKTRLQGIYEQVQSTAGAPLLVVGYPDLFPAPGSASAARAHKHCGWMDDGDMSRFADVAKALDETMSGAASAAGVDYLSIRDALKDHELCTGHSWIRSLGGKPGDLVGDSQNGHPLKEGQLAIAERVVRWMLSHRQACTAPTSVAAIVDDSGSMERTDPDKIRAQALRLMLTKPTNQSLTFGAVEFGGDAGPLFAPGVISQNQQAMLAGLGGLNNDGFTDGGNTDYNEAFAVSAQQQPGPGARIFLTDGGHNVGSYNDGHRGGAPTYVIGLGIGPSGAGNSDADLLGRIANDTGGRYYPLLLQDSDSSQLQLSRLQPALNDIDTRIGCRAVQAERTVQLSQAGARSGALNSLFAGKAGMEAVVSWTDPAARVAVSSVTVRDRLGRVVGDLSGTKRVAHTRRMRTKMQLDTVQGETFDTVTLRRPAYGRTLALTVSASQLPAGVPVTIQLRPLDSVPVTSGGGTGGGGGGGGGAGPKAPAPVKPTATKLAATSPAANSVQIGVDVSVPAGHDPASCRVFQDGTQIASAACATGRFSKGLTGVSAGTHNFYVTVVDATGATSDPSNTVQVNVPGPPQRINAYDNYGSANAGHPMCRGNPGNGQSVPGGTVTQTFTVPGAVKQIDSAQVQIDPDLQVTAHLQIYVGGALRASADAGASGDTNFSFPAVSVSPGDQVTVRINFTATFGKIITVYTAGSPGGTFAVSNSCSAGAENSTSTATGLRAVVYGWTG